jgi:hypothetical protein
LRENIDHKARDFMLLLIKPSKSSSRSKRVGY